MKHITEQEQIDATNWWQDLSDYDIDNLIIGYKLSKPIKVSDMVMMHKRYLDKVSEDSVTIDANTEILLKQLLSDFLISIPDMNLNIAKTAINKDSGNHNVHGYVNAWLNYKNIKRTF